jgi:hypothetical protein
MELPDRPMNWTDSSDIWTFRTEYGRAIAATSYEAVRLFGGICWDSHQVAGIGTVLALFCLRFQLIPFQSTGWWFITFIRLQLFQVSMLKENVTLIRDFFFLGGGGVELYFVQLETRDTEPSWFRLVNVFTCRPRSHMGEWIYGSACSYPVHCLDVKGHFYASVPFALGTAPPFPLLVGWVGVRDPDWSFWWGNKFILAAGNRIISSL